MTSALDLLSSDARRELLQIIKRKGGLSVDEAVDTLGMARTTVREHLLQLMEKGLLTRTPEREGRGRPSHRYELSRKAEGLFPSRDGELLGQLLRFLRDRGDDDLVQIFFEEYWAQRTRDVKARLRDARTGDLDETLDVLASILEEEGFMPDIDRQERTITIRECNCPFPESVKQTKIPCRLEHAFFENLFETDLERVSYIPEGNPACTYTLSRETIADVHPR